MKKENREVSKYETENPDIIRVSETYEIKRYEPHAYYSQEECETTVDEIKDCCKIYVPRGDYSNLTTFEINYDDLNGKTLADDLAIFQNKLDEEFGKDEYEAFVLGAYIHSGTSFSVNKTGNHVCQWDSSQLGFIGLKKNVEDCYSAEHPDKVAEMLTAAWNGEFVEYVVYDNYNDEVVNSIITSDYKELNKWFDDVKTKYNVSFDNIGVED